MHKITNPGLEIIPLSVESVDAQIKELETATAQEIINGGRFVNLDQYREYIHDAKNESEEENDFDWDDDDDEPW